MRNIFVFCVFIINLKINLLEGASLNSSNLYKWENQLSRTIRQANAEECIPPTIPNGIINIIKRKLTGKNKFLSLNITCDDNYILQPSIDFFITCFNGFWDVDEIPQCKRCVKRSAITAIEGTTDSQLFCPESILENRIYRECGQRLDKTHQPFVVNGSVSKFAEFPWHVAIYKKDQKDLDPIYHCGGSIINDKNILTAAHCLTDGYGKIIPSREYYAAAGKYHREYISDSQTSQRRKIIRTNLHPHYKGELTNYAWDIAMITVHEPFEISTLVHPVCIDWKTQFENEHFTPETYGEVAGWGKTETNLYMSSSELRVLKVPFIEHQQCIKFVPNSFIKYITHDKFCAGYTNGSSVCDGDSGGGLVFEREEKGQSKYYIRGIVSVGLQKEGRCDEYKYSTYTKVSEYITFIREIIENKDNSTETFESLTTTSLPEISVNSTGPSVSCKTPNNEEAKCISIYDCEIFVNALQNSPTNEVINYMKDSICGEKVDKKVCCGSTINYFSVIFSNPVTSKPIIHKNLNLLPTPGVCGRQSMVRRGRIVGGIAADLYDYPWMALLEYGSAEHSAGFLCAGFLINERYVVTVALCAAKSRNTDFGRVFRVRLGEYDTNTEIDCVNSKCADAPLNVDIEEIVVHPSYDSRKKINDIALLRLTKSVSYTDFIKPICLPLNGETSAPGRRLYMAGWGTTDYAGEPSPTKLKVSVYAAPQEECIKAYNDTRFQIHSSHLCIGNAVGKDSCQGDSGGPIMATLSNSSNIYADGIISFGKSCGTGVPSVATRVASFMDWILDVIQP